MSIESGSAAASHKSLGAVDHRGGKKSGKADMPADASSNFSMLMGMLAAAQDPVIGTEPAADATVAVVANAPVDPAAFDKNIPLDQSAYALTAINSQAMQTLAGTAQQSLAASSGSLGGLTQDATGGLQVANAAALMQTSASVVTQPIDLDEKSHLTQSGKALPAINLRSQLTPQEITATPLGGASDAGQRGSLPSLALDAIVSNEKLPLAQSESALQASNLQASNLQAMLVQRESRLGPMGAAMKGEDVAIAGGAGAAVDQADLTSSVAVQPELRSGTQGMAQAQNLSGVQADLKEARMHVSTLDMAARSEVSSTLSLLTGAAESGLRAQEPLPAKSPGARFGDASAGAFGVASGVSTRADAPYEIEATAAAVPDTAIAETVSYWVTQGVQSAELTLEGFGNDPVEVSISLTGDQAQIDFRTDQADVRQALEAATAELRDLLSGEGLQLAGVSVGASGGRGAQGDAQQANPGPRQEVLTQGPSGAPTPRSVRSSNPAVGRSLDLFV